MSIESDTEKFMVTLIFIVIFFILGGMIFSWNNQKRDPPLQKSGPAPPQDVLMMFEAFCKLANHCYNTPFLRDEGIIFGADKYNFKLKDAHGGGEIWLWEINYSGSVFEEDPKWVVVIRGSSSLLDFIFTDVTLAEAVGGGKPEKYAKVIDDYVKKVIELIKGHIVDGSPFILCGHSLGASVAEALHSKLSKAKFRVAGSVTFDSPGPPPSYRTEENGFTLDALKRIWTLNARPNIVNTVSKPCATAHFYVCGRGRQIFVDEIFKSLPGIFGATISDITKGILKSLFLSHDVGRILNFIQEGKILKEDPENWPIFSASGLKFFWGHFLKRKSSVPVPASVPMSVAPLALAPVHDPVPLELHGNIIHIDQAPHSLKGFKRCVPYIIEFLNLPELIEKIVAANGIIVPLIGETGQGKTVTFGRLLNRDLDINLSNSPLEDLVGRGRNSSPLPLVAYWKDKIVNGKTLKVFLLDLPGFGGRNYGKLLEKKKSKANRKPSQQNLNQTPYEDLANVAEQQLENVLNVTGFSFPLVIIVVKGLINDQTQNYYKNLQVLFPQKKLVVACNLEYQSITTQKTMDGIMKNYRQVFPARVEYVTYSTIDNVNPDFTILKLDDYLSEVQIGERPVRVQPGSRFDGWRDFVLELVPVVGPIFKCVKHCKEKKYGRASVDGIFVVVDAATLGLGAGVVYRAPNLTYRLVTPLLELWARVGISLTWTKLSKQHPRPLLFSKNPQRNLPRLLLNLQNMFKGKS